VGVAGEAGVVVEAGAAVLSADARGLLSGLRPDMLASAIRKLYPRARKHGNNWWLITAYSPIGDGGYFAPITANVKNGQVIGFDVWVGGTGE
jgi:hypothetical protein